MSLGIYSFLSATSSSFNKSPCPDSPNDTLSTLKKKKKKKKEGGLWNLIPLTEASSGLWSSEDFRFPPGFLAPALARQEVLCAEASRGWNLALSMYREGQPKSLGPKTLDFNLRPKTKHQNTSIHWDVLSSALAFTNVTQHRMAQRRGSA